MKGLRGPELCDGSFLQHVAVFTVNESELVTRHVRDLDVEQQTVLIADWSRLAAFVKTTLKLSPWKSLPLLIVGLGHPGLVQGCAAQAKNP